MTDAVLDTPPATRPAARRRPLLASRRNLERVLPWAIVIGLFAVWEASVHLFAIPRFVLPAPSVIFESMWQWRVPILDNAWQTLFTTTIGFAIAIVFGLVTGVLIGSSTLVYNGFYPVLIGFNS
ncbi:MAG: ABC transporter permease, partial [Rhodobacteraceae bacterium]